MCCIEISTTVEFVLGLSDVLCSSALSILSHDAGRLSGATFREGGAMQPDPGCQDASVLCQAPLQMKYT